MKYAASLYQVVRNSLDREQALAIMHLCILVTLIWIAAMEKKCPVVFELLQSELTRDIGLLILRLGVAGFMLFGHGLGKLLNFSSQYMQFPDPLGVSSPVSLALVVGAEFFCSFAVIVGFATRLACIPLIITMLVAAFVIHADDPWQKKEFALLFLIPFLSLCFTGPGRLSLDSFIFADRK